MSKAAFAASRRATILIPDTGPQHDRGKSHLFVVLTEPDSDGMVLLVPICTKGQKYDTACLVGKGDHPFLDRPSYVDYSNLNTYKAQVLESQAQKGILVAKEVIDEKVFALICAGIEQSRQSPPIYKKYFSQQTKKKG